MSMKDIIDAQILLALNKKSFKYQWSRATTNEDVKSVLRKASKKKTGLSGYPDQIYINEEEHLLILVEDKTLVTAHQSEPDKPDNPERYAVDGLKWYISLFIKNPIFEAWKIVGIAVSGDIEDTYNHKISTFIVRENEIELIPQVNSFLNEKDYLRLFINVDEEEMIERIGSSSKKINKMLRSIDSQKRPILLSALMIALFEVSNSNNSFIREFESNSGEEIITKLPNRVREVLRSENIPEEKLNIILNQITFLETQLDLKNNNILRDILKELRDEVIPYFDTSSNYDIMGSFYSEFLRYAGISNVKNGIVLTPAHITQLFTELVPIRPSDVIFDPAAGSGAFLIAGMNALIKKIENSNLADKQSKILNVKQKQLIGFELNSTMYTLSISNMLFRHDGKSQLYNLDSFSEEAKQTLRRLAQDGIKPTIGFVNPPYGGKETKSDPTPKEISFLKLLLDSVSDYVIMIAPLSTYFKDETTRNGILAQHTLKYVINMPADLFQPNAATITAISVFHVGQPQGDQETIMVDLVDDGFVLSKNKGRTDIFNRWPEIKQDLFNKLENIDDYADNITCLKTKLENGDEWLLQAFSTTDYSHLTEASFENAIKEQLIFEARKELNLLDKDIDEVELLSILADYYSEEEAVEDED
ncbi:type II DNA modification (methyltransferase subunit) (plasmid) [Alkalihalophilus pseudofirmus OF4]|uniref:site-specific DNA-methyltransferase (adenine-specific) n=1 Tax=Alkalihalophilus pseudofirmus (strain ATCC BAA-2126 / JCM 17055 / OF4) TaxID=398511 RepID=D3G1N5_ALKPO|nr:N-6 DNA methylase [Alkalihalophilus pseudofirmus]ADC52261.1 type II DNA modification (methyltransferase subunit) [Alkalihalophilus pseudofirmus OF4]